MPDKISRNRSPGLRSPRKPADSPPATPRKKSAKITDQAAAPQRPRNAPLLPAPLTDAAGAPSAHRITKQLEAIHWRPQSSGRSMVQLWLQEIITHATRDVRHHSAAARIRLVRALTDEDLSSSKHPSQRMPNDCAKSPYAFRTWPDKVQTLVAFDQVVGGADVPESARLGTYNPVVLYRPRYTVVMLTPAPDNMLMMHFAETAQTRLVAADKLTADLCMPRPRDAALFRARTTAGLLQLRDVCGCHESYLVQRLLPALNDKTLAPSSLPLFGLCTAAKIRQARQAYPHDALAAVAWLRKDVESEQMALKPYTQRLAILAVSELTDNVDASPHIEE